MHAVPGRQQADALEQRQVREDVLEAEVLVERRVTDPPRHARVQKQRLDLRRKQERAAVEVPVQRLDAVSIARDEQSAPRSIEDGEREHAVEPIEAVLTPLLESMNDHFGVGVRSELVPQRLELAPQLAEIV